MNRRIVYRDHWDKLLVEIIDDGDDRSLFFGGDVLQSSMSLSDPCRLVLSYTRYMMAALMINDAPDHVLIIGVGAGSMIRFLHRYLPYTRIDGIDSAPHIIRLARGYFLLPDDERVMITCDDGSSFLEHMPEPANYDLIFIDAFDGDGMAPTIYHPLCYDLCRRHLLGHGIVVINLWSGDAAKLAAAQEDISACFEATLNLPVPHRGNIICLAGSRTELDKATKRSRHDLDLLRTRFDMDFSPVAKTCRAINRSSRPWLTRLFS